jgi:hypothetical protein
VKCAARRLEIELAPDNSVRIILRCDAAYEAAVLFDTIASSARNEGVVFLEFDAVERTR